jgi:hypothetical protein
MNVTITWLKQNGMRATAVPEDPLMRSKFHIAGHMDYSDEIRRDGKEWLFCQDDVSDIPKRAFKVKKGSRDVGCELDFQRKHKPGCKATNECFAAANSASHLSRPAKGNFAALITSSDESTFCLVMGPNQLNQ